MLGNTRRRAMALVTTGLVAGAIGIVGPQSASAHHCSQMYMFSGYQSPQARGPWLNAGTVGCPLVNYDDRNTDTNFLTPGSNGVSIRLRTDPYGVDTTPPVGTVVDAGRLDVTYDTPAGARVEATVGLRLTWTGTTWNGQDVVVDGTLVRATGTVRNQTGSLTTVTYRAVGEDS